MTTSASFWRDANRVPIIQHGLVAKKTIVFTGDGATIATPIFKITGIVEVLKLWGVVITQFGASHTDAHFRINDQTAYDVVISKSTTLDLGSISPGASIIKNGLAAAVLQYKTSDAGSMLEPAVVQQQIFSPFVVVQKTGDIETDIEYVYTTADTPTSGSMEFFAGFLPISEGADLAAI